MVLLAMLLSAEERNGTLPPVSMAAFGPKFGMTLSERQNSESIFRKKYPFMTYKVQRVNKRIHTVVSASVRLSYIRRVQATGRQFRS